MIHGWFNEASGRPQVRARVALVGQLVEDEIVLDIDTGSDMTMISPSHAELLGIDVAKLEVPTLISGIGGLEPIFPAKAAILFHDPDRGLCVYYVEVGVFPAEADAGRFDPLPSLLGRDVLDRVRMTYHRRGDGLLIEPSEPDAVV